jgi:insertion element IS1 protein InsB
VAKKKLVTLPSLASTLLPPVEPPILELDELWSFVFSKENKRWVWLAKARHSAQIVAYALGDRREKTCRLLWQRIPKPYRHALCYTDFWQAYTNVIPTEQPRAVGKDSGQTAHIERRNNTLRQRLARFTRQSLAFSKSDFRHEGCLRLFLHRFNHEIIP